MPMNSALNQLRPPLQLAWRSSVGLSHAVAAPDSLYGIRNTGQVVALRASDGTSRWQGSFSYLPNHLVRQGTRLFAFAAERGLAYIDDQGEAVSEFVAMSFRASPQANIAAPVIDDRWIYLLVNQGLYVIHQDDGLQYGHVPEGMQPLTVVLYGHRDLVVIDGRGIPSRFRVGQTSLEQVWTGTPHGLSVGLSERPHVISGNRLILGLDAYTVAYDLSSGSIAWILPNVPSRVLRAEGPYVYAGFHGSSLWALRVNDGSTVWHRQYIYDVSLQGPYSMTIADDYIYFGGVLRTNPDGAVLLAVNKATGSVAWMSRSVALPWAGGMPTVGGNHVYAYGAAHTGAYTPLAAEPRVVPGLITVTPNPLRGRASGFGTGQVRVNMPVQARVSIAPYREATGLGTPALYQTTWNAGNQQVNWTVSGGGGFNDRSQFGYMLVDVEEQSGPTYTQAILLSVNTFPDIMRHWAQNDIEIMLYHQYVSGYPDQTFKPNNLVTRAESATIIAKTLGIAGPSPGFRTKFTDIQSHWARQAIMALEERGVIGGFAEPDGTFTFRPELNMTRAQEARILVNAYQIPAAPGDFVSRFTDITGHWAAPDIIALEAAGYIQGFREPNGTYTYRPEQFLTRAEMCAIIVRIRALTR